MIKEIIERFEASRLTLRTSFEEGHPDNYEDIVRRVVKAVTSFDQYGDHNLDPDRITVIDDGDYQGTLMFVIAAKGYQPYDYWYVKVSYGSCSGCDTFESIRDYSSYERPDEDQVDRYMQLALNVAQGLKKTAGYCDE